MKIFRNTIAMTMAVTILLALFGIAFGYSTPAAGAAEKAAEVKYAPVTSGAYNLDPAHSTIGFAVRHLEINWVDGRFKDFTGTINFDEKDVTRSTVNFTAKIESIDTEVAQRDEHLRSADFFDAEKYPELKFVSTKIEKRGGKDRYTLIGDLTIKDVTKQVSVPFTYTGAVSDPWGGTRFGIEGSTRINRRDFNINYGNALPFGGFDVGNEVSIILKLEAVKAQPAAAE